MGISCSSVLTSEPIPNRFDRCFFKLTFFVVLLFSQYAQANLDEDNWLFHWKNKDYTFKRQGERRGTPLICVDEIAKKLQIPLGTVKTKCRTALITLRQTLNSTD